MIAPPRCDVSHSYPRIPKLSMRPVRRREAPMSICTTGHLYTSTIAVRQTPDTPDAALIRLIAAGDKHAMHIMFARHNVRVFRFVFRFVGNKSAAEDLV